MALTDVLGSALPAAGMVFGGPAGAAVGALAGGLFQNAAADRKMDQWNKLDREIPLNDPIQQQMLGRMERQERQYRGATDPSSALASKLSQQAGAQTQTNLARAGGPGLVQNALSSQNVTQRNLAGIGAQAAQQADSMLGQQGNLVNLMAQRRYDRQRYRRDIAMAQGAQKQQDANNQMMAAIGMLPTLGGSNFNGVFGNRSQRAMPTPGTPGAPQPTQSLLPQNYQLGSLNQRPAYNYGFGHAPPAGNNYGLI